jgi:TrmH family RNA methyltransferase
LLLKDSAEADLHKSSAANRDSDRYCLLLPAKQFCDSTCRKIDLLPVQSELGGLVVVLVRPRNPLNIGAAARAMSNFGARRLRLVNPYAPGFREARSAVGASELLDQADEYKTVAEAVADCALVVGTTAVRNRVLQQPVQPLDERAGTTIRLRLQTERVALLFGSEKIGLTNRDFSHCHWLLNIPTAQQNISMNLGQAVAVCLYELARTTRARTTPLRPATEDAMPATAGAAEQITEGLLEALRISGYVKPGTEAMFEKKARRLVFRFHLEAYDAKLLLGMVRQIVWKLRQANKTV